MTYILKLDELLRQLAGILLATVPYVVSYSFKTWDIPRPHAENERIRRLGRQAVDVHKELSRRGRVGTQLSQRSRNTPASAEAQASFAPLNERENRDG